MPREDRFYVLKFKNPVADGGSDHFMVMQLDADAPLKKYLELMKVGRPQLNIDVEQQAPHFSSKHEAEVEARRLGDVAQQANPDRVGAETQFPAGEANRIVEVGNPGARVIQ